ncbi:MAG: CCA tRNA nucleotidyltransferase [Chlamydiales bacterium]
MINTSLFVLGKSICQILSDRGYIAYFAGGWVRQFLLDQSSDDIDIATSAPPQVVQNFFSKTIPVGLAFGVVIVVLEGVNFEVATFRQDDRSDDGRHPMSIEFADPKADALRRDFTINGMFFDPLTDRIYDYVEGKKDLTKKIIRTIGDPFLRFSEDRLRMVRACRFSARLGFIIEEKTRLAIKELAPTLFPAVSIERIWQEFCKMALYPHFNQALILLKSLGLLGIIFPQLKEVDVEKLVAPFPDFPLHCPPIIYLMELFPYATLNERLSLCEDLKISKAEKQEAIFFTQSMALLEQASVDNWHWAHFYAHPSSAYVIGVYAAHAPLLQRSLIFKAHQEREQFLKKHIDRIKNQTPLITSTMLKNQGVKPGKKMGQLLKSAERLSINHDLNDPSILLRLLDLEDIGQVE